MLVAWAAILLVVLLLLGMPIGVAMGLSGLALAYSLLGPASFLMAAKNMIDTLNDQMLIAIPLFVMVGAIMMKGGVGDDLFRLFDSFLGHVPGGVGVAVVLTCAVMSAMCGSSVGVVAAVAPMAITNLAKRGYSLELSLGLPASGGGLGILMPLSVGMIAYSAVTGESVRKLLMAGLVPALICVVLFSAYTFWAYRRSGSTTVGRRSTWAERWHALKRAGWALTIPVVLIVGVYTGIATITEVAAIGCAWSLIVCAFVYRRFTWGDLIPTLRHGLSLSVMVMFLIATALLLGNALTVGGVAEMIAGFVAERDIPLWGFLVFSMAVLLILGIPLEGLSMLFLTMPVFTPILQGYGFSLIAYAVMFALNVELAMLSPPVGLTVQTAERIGRNLGLPVGSGTAWRGIVPFFIIYTVVMILVGFFPGLALWLPMHMK